MKPCATDWDARPAGVPAHLSEEDMEHRILDCTNCNKSYCRNCTDSSYPDDYCSKECEEEYYLENDEEEDTK
jgi:hypothetical protein